MTHISTDSHPVIQSCMRKRFGISHPDALIIETARSAGCAEVYSEDLTENQDYAGIGVINPFQPN